MSAPRRVIYLLYSLVLLVIAVGLALYLSPVLYPQAGLDTYLHQVLISWVYGKYLGFTLLVLLALGALVLLMRSLFAKRYRSSLVDEREQGQVLISRDALSSVVFRTIENIPGARCMDCMVTVVGKRSPQLKVAAEVSLYDAQQSLAHTASILQDKVKQRLEHFSGYEVEAVDLHMLEAEPEAMVEDELYAESASEHELMSGLAEQEVVGFETPDSAGDLTHSAHKSS